MRVTRGITRAYYWLKDSLSKSAQLERIKKGHLVYRDIRIASSFDEKDLLIRGAVWREINKWPDIICTGAELNKKGVMRLSPDAEKALSQREATPETVVRVFYLLAKHNRTVGQIRYLVGLLKANGIFNQLDKQSDILSRLGEMDQDLTRRINAELLQSRT
jgi:hypothetical protein